MSSTVAARRSFAYAAVIAVVARLASIFLWPPDADASHARMLAAAGAHPGAWAAASFAEVVAWVAAGAAVLAVTGLVSGAGVWPTRIGGWVYGASLLALGLVGGAMNSVTEVLARQPGRAAMVRVQDDLHTFVLNVFVALILLGTVLPLVFAAGLVRARLVGWSFLVLSVLALAGFLLTADSSDHLVNLAGFVPLGATWVVLARLLWAHAPAPRRAPLADPVAAVADRGRALRSS